MCEGFWLENRNEKYCLEDHDVDVKMTTNGSYRDAVGGKGRGLYSSGSVQGQVAGSCVQGNETSGCI
jgi:hypothetical protein